MKLKTATAKGSKLAGGKPSPNIVGNIGAKSMPKGLAKRGKK